MRRFGRPAIVLVLSAVAACGGGSPQEKGTPGAGCPHPTGIVSVGEPIPANCSLERLDGGVLKLADLKGKPAVINFWASWCTFCISEMPGIQKVFAALGGRVAIVGADLLGVQGETKTAATTFGRSTKVKYPLVYDAGGLLYGHFSARPVMPTTIIVNAKGIVVDRLFGPLTERQLRSLLRKDVGLA